MQIKELMIICVIFQINRYEIRYVLKSVLIFRCQYDRLIANPEEYDIRGNQTSFRLMDDPCFFLEALFPLREDILFLLKVQFSGLVLLYTFKTSCCFDCIFGFSHFFRSANNSSKSLYPFTD